MRKIRGPTIHLGLETRRSSTSVKRDMIQDTAMDTLCSPNARCLKLSLSKPIILSNSEGCMIWVNEVDQWIDSRLWIRMWMPDKVPGSVDFKVIGGTAGNRAPCSYKHHNPLWILPFGLSQRHSIYKYSYQFLPRSCCCEASRQLKQNKKMRIYQSWGNPQNTHISTYLVYPWLHNPMEQIQSIGYCQGSVLTIDGFQSLWRTLERFHWNDCDPNAVVGVPQIPANRMAKYPSVGYVPNPSGLILAIATNLEQVPSNYSSIGWRSLKHKNRVRKLRQQTCSYKVPRQLLTVWLDVAVVTWSHG